MNQKCLNSVQFSKLYKNMNLWNKEITLKGETNTTYRYNNIHLRTIKIKKRTNKQTFNSKTRSILFFPRGLMSFSINAMMISIPLLSWTAIQFWNCYTQ